MPTLRFNSHCHNLPGRSASRATVLSGLGVLLLFLGYVRVGCGADPYASALDKRFAVAPSDAPSSQVAALEDGLKTQVRQMAQPVQPDSTAASSGVESTFLWEMVTACGVGVLALVGLRQWHQTLIRPEPKPKASPNPVAEDPAMAEFLRAMQESVKKSISESIQAEPAPVKPKPEPVQAKAPPVMENVVASEEAFKKLGRTTDETEKLNLLRELLRHVELVKEGSGLTQMRSVWLLATALHGLLKQFSIKSSNMTPSAMRTAATAVDLLKYLASRSVRADLATDPPVRLLAVDDDAISRRAVAMALKKIFNEPDIAPDGPSALGLAAQHEYDVIFLDIEMPGMDGFEVCSKLRESDRNHNTPVVFVTTHHDFDSRAKSALVGAQDLMGKPFLAFEIAVKALTLVLKTREQREAQAAAHKPDSASEPALEPALA